MAAKISIEDLPGEVLELTDDELDLVVGTMMPDTGYTCTASGGGPDEDCSRD